MASALFSGMFAMPFVLFMAFTGLVILYTEPLQSLTSGHLHDVREGTSKVSHELQFPAEHWVPLKTTNPIESTFATVRLRTRVTKGPGSANAGIAMAILLSKPNESYQMSKLNAQPKNIICLSVFLLTACGHPKPIALHPVSYEELTTQVETAISRCMNKAGFDYFPKSLDAIRRANSNGVYYGVASSLTQTTEQDSNQLYRSQLAPLDQQQYDKILVGSLKQQSTGEVTETGCTGSAKSKLRAQFDHYRQVNVKVQQSLALDKTYQTALTLWRSCMRTSGHDFSAQVDASNAVFRKREMLNIFEISDPGFAELEAFEREIFVLDERCLRSSGINAALETIQQGVWLRE